MHAVAGSTGFDLEDEVDFPLLRVLVDRPRRPARDLLVEIEPLA